MYRTALSKLLFIARLVIIVSLAGYTLSNASAAMHGKAFPELSQLQTQPIHGDDLAQIDEHDHSGTNSSADDGAGQTKECCKDFCGGFAIIGVAPDLCKRIFTTKKLVANDDVSFGQMPTLDRPPNI